MKYSKEQLIEMVRPYFENDKVESLFVTEDNQVFYPNKKTAAFSHCRVYKLRMPFEITRADLPVKETEKVSEIIENESMSEEKSKKELLLEKAESLGIDADKRMGIKKLESLIKEKENAGE